jgi:NAD(P)-dependent dehydrogenase (short-subunit alcohol dehydrogenase family)
MSPSGELTGRIALVTGSGRTGGIGAAVAHRLAREGAEVVIVGRDAARGAQVAEAITAEGGTARLALVDLSVQAEVERLVDEAGAVDVLVNNAASYRAICLPSLEQSVAANDESWDTNVRANFILSTGLAKGMIARRRGSIISISSIASMRPFPEGGSTYAAQKAAIESYARSFAVEWGPYNVRVNAVAPGGVLTEAVVDFLTAEEFESNARAVPMRRNATPEEIAEVVLFLASDRSSFVTGQTLIADGGRRHV